MIDALFSSFITFFIVIDPIGTIPVFIAVTASSKDDERKKIALKAALTAAGVLLFFIVVGELILNAIDIPLPTFQIAGGIVLFLFALTMIFGESKPEEELSYITSKRIRLFFHWLCHHWQAQAQYWQLFCLQKTVSIVLLINR